MDHCWFRHVDSRFLPRADVVNLAVVPIEGYSAIHTTIALSGTDPSTGFRRETDPCRPRHSSFSGSNPQCISVIPVHNSQSPGDDPAGGLHYRERTFLRLAFGCCRLCHGSMLARPQSLTESGDWLLPVSVGFASGRKFDLIQSSASMIDLVGSVGNPGDRRLPRAGKSIRSSLTLCFPTPNQDAVMERAMGIEPT